MFLKLLSLYNLEDSGSLRCKEGSCTYEFEPLSLSHYLFSQRSSNGSATERYDTECLGITSGLRENLQSGIM